MPAVTSLSSEAVNVLHNLCLTKKQAAQYLGVSEVTIWHWVKADKLHAYRIGREVLIEKTELEKLRR